MDNKKRIISCLLVTALLSTSLFSTVQTANAGSDYGASEWAVHYLQVAAEVAATVALQRLTTQILNKVTNSGPGGTAGFIQNWINFETQSQYQGEGIFRAELGKATLCSYFSNSLKSLFGAGTGASLLGQNVRTNNLDPFSVRTNCTMPPGFTLTNYQKDFSGNGGWQSFSRMLEPQINYYGSLFQSLDEVSAQRSLAEKSNTAKATAGAGYFGFGEKDCKLRVANKCLIPGDIKTPGSTVDKSVANALDSSAKSLSTSRSDAIAITAITVLTTLVVNKLFDLTISSEGGSDFQIPSPQRSADSYKQEFCMAEDNISADTGSWIKDNYPATWSKYPVEQPACRGHARLFGIGGYSHNACGKSYCEQVREEFDKNSYPYSRCTESCMNDLKGAPGTGLLPGVFTPGTFVPTPTPTPSPSDGPPVPCTAKGRAEQDFILPLVNGGTSPKDVAVMTNTKFELTSGSEAVYYPVKAGDPAPFPSEVIGLPEFYVAEPDSRPHVPGDWFVVSRCTP